jgi:hypothetical protein
MKKILVIAICFFAQARSQTIVSDSEGNEMFNFFTGNSISAELETGEDEFTFNYNLPFKSFYYVASNYDETDSLYRVNNNSKTIATSYNLQTTVKFFNSMGEMDFSKGEDFKLGFEIGLGFQKTVDEIYNIKLLNRYSLGVAYGASFYVRRDNLVVYNSDTGVKGSESPVSYGVKWNAAIFKSRDFATQFSGTIGFRQWNIDDLSDFYINKPVFSNEDIIAFDSEIVGKYGKLSHNPFYQFRFANPVFLFDKTNFLGRLALTPYLTCDVTDESSPEYRYGIMVNVLGDAVTSTAAYKITKGFGLGIDKSDSDDNPIFFLRGTFNFGEIKLEKRIVEPEQDK